MQDIQAEVERINDFHMLALHCAASQKGCRIARQLRIEFGTQRTNLKDSNVLVQDMQADVVEGIRVFHTAALRHKEGVASKG